MSDLNSPRISIVFLLYNTAKTVPELVKRLGSQRHPSFESQSQWLEALFMNDCSLDATQTILESELTSLKNPPYYRTITHSKNLGLAATLNHAFELARGNFVLTCHCDALFGDNTYVASMLELMEQNPQAAAITGKPIVSEDAKIPFAEKLNLITNLMDIVPVEAGRNSLIPIGFAEGRCDIFRVEALSKIGYYSSSLRTSGEDQLSAARLRQKGYEIYQAPAITYHLSVSTEQDTLSKIAKHQSLFGRTHPYILLKQKGTELGILGNRAGSNRRLRSVLRLSQLAFSMLYLLEAVFVFTGAFVLALVVLFFILIAKIVIFRNHMKAIRLNSIEFIKFFGYQPVLDLCYSIGFIQGLWIIIFNKDISKAS